VYHVLLLLTDGVIHDMEETKQFIIDCAFLACSIIIIGVGNADFSAMVELDGDGDDVLTDSTGRKTPRDIV
jgi:copine 5/8/9